MCVLYGVHMSTTQTYNIIMYALNGPSRLWYGGAFVVVEHFAACSSLLSVWWKMVVGSSRLVVHGTRLRTKHMWEDYELALVGASVCIPLLVIKCVCVVSAWLAGRDEDHHHCSARQLPASPLACPPACLTEPVCLFCGGALHDLIALFLDASREHMRAFT